MEGFMQNYWISWWTHEHEGAYELHSPWWVTGERHGRNAARSICAGVKAKNVEAAKELIKSSYNNNAQDLEWRFIETMPVEWSPFNDRFPKADWMKWV